MADEDERHLLQPQELPESEASDRCMVHSCRDRVGGEDACDGAAPGVGTRWGFRLVSARLTLRWTRVHVRLAQQGYRGPVDAFALHRSERDGCAVLAVEGEVDLATAPRLREALTDLVTKGNLRVVVDLTATQFLDSTGLGALVTGLKRVRARGGELRVVCTSSRLCKVFEITSIDKVIPLYTSVDEACVGL